MPRLSADFHSNEIPGWERYPPDVQARVAEHVRTVLQPARRRWGKIVITSGLRESGSHLEGALDWVPVEALQEGHELEDVGQWVATYLPTAFGELIVEPVPYGGTSTGHIHSTPPGIGSPGRGEFLIEVDFDRFEFGGAHSALLLLMLGAYLVVLTLSGGLSGW